MSRNHEFTHTDDDGAVLCAVLHESGNLTISVGEPQSYEDVALIPFDVFLARLGFYRTEDGGFRPQAGAPPC
jgi:hypothetical protein